MSNHCRRWCVLVVYQCQRPVCLSVLVLLSTHCRRWSVAGCCIPADVPAACVGVVVWLVVYQCQRPVCVLVAVVSVLLSACRSASVPMVAVLVLVRCCRSLGVWY